AIAGKLVLHQIKQQQTLQDTDLATFQKFSPQIKADVYSALDQTTAVKRRNSYGGTGFAQVEQQIELAEQFMQKFE
ncbi:MAG TPA: argininosuccinate lyase, partial [Lactobacillus sp.]|nr:argininosuccinate lyase [Lactobacillus sp.]